MPTFGIYIGESHKAIIFSLSHTESELEEMGCKSKKDAEIDKVYKYKLNLLYHHQFCNTIEQELAAWVGLRREQK